MPAASKAFDIKDKTVIRNYDQVLFPFRDIFSEFCREMLGCPEVEKLHEYIPDDRKPDKILGVGEDQKTYGHSLLYQIDPGYQEQLGTGKGVKDRGFVSTYQRFIRFLETDTFSEALVYQRLPTLRIHFPRNLSVGEYHRDRNYNHPDEEVNIWIPVTRAHGTATIHIENSYNAGDHQPIEVYNGQYLIFDSALEHGNEVNVENYTRVSFDFRVIPLSKYKSSSQQSINQGMKFAIGDYYAVNSSS